MVWCWVGLGGLGLGACGVVSGDLDTEEGHVCVKLKLLLIVDREEVRLVTDSHATCGFSDNPRSDTVHHVAQLCFWLVPHLRLGRGGVRWNGVGLGGWDGGNDWNGWEVGDVACSLLSRLAKGLR